jgi:hypothetical protein
MKKIKTILFRFLRGEAHFQFLTLFNELLIEFPSAKSIVISFYNEFVALLAQEKTIVDAKKRSDYTKQIAEANDRNDQLIIGIKETVSAALHHFNEMVVEAAESIFGLLKAFGDIAGKSYEEEAAAIKILIDDLLSEKYSAKTTLLGLDPWVVELSTSLETFESLIKKRNIEQSEKPQQKLLSIRRKLDIIYKNMTDMIASADMLDTADTYTEFIKRLNVQIVYFNEHNHRPARKNIKNANIDVIPVQMYTGKAITPIPVVHLDDKELTFAKDFTLTYKNNVNPGVATVGLLGKGIYTGKKSVTFNIEATDKGKKSTTVNVEAQDNGKKIITVNTEAPENGKKIITVNTETTENGSDETVKTDA